MKLAIGLPTASLIDDDLSLLRGTLNDVHWVSNKHGIILLQSLGQVDRYHLIEDIGLALSTITWSPFTIKLQQILHHQGHEKDRLTSPVMPNDDLTHLQKRIASRLKAADCPPSSLKTLSPELTLGYLLPDRHHDVIPWIQRHNLFSSQPIRVDHICLIEQFGYNETLPFQVLETYSCYGQRMDPSLFSDEF
ncbi:hypothetical protein GS501_03745 [Saccharibacter sp. 17.LH.SD]|uniref:2'-5' RNA ligase family protein n=1 Tax=Saccharibacter sp. 17.LH.SD TaxID=2689393 RepID=UPI00136E5EBD|nr:hypothetical protein [Saccharibacter sp. 17.LH.SD]MXV44168.1 hypothetical protein [Saccharibacter sp. 17.LH.SD]